VIRFKFQLILHVALKTENLVWPGIRAGKRDETDLPAITQDIAIAIWGAGGIGETSLARAVLPHPDTFVKFPHRFFVSAESPTTSIELAAPIGLHVGLNPRKDLTKVVVQYFSRQPSCLLVLDNLETVWEPMQSQCSIEEFLSLLTGVDQLALIVCLWHNFDLSG
jgi:hypothetical protein